VRCGDHLFPILAAAVALTATACCQQARAQGFPATEQRTLLAEAGSTGGSIGRTDKSISGGEERSTAPDTGPGRRVNRNSSREEAFPKAIQLNEHWHGLNYSISLRNVGGGNYQGTWSHGYVTKFTVTAFTKNSMKLERTDSPAIGACSGSYTGTRTGNHAEGEASISNGAVSKWDASW
jgi:hypothetical protein